ncbi:unknown [Clostridium sp. CAG:448]|nr:unknown [Clostridium sp. CAG:448]
MHCGNVTLFCDIPLLFHFRQDQISAFTVVFRMGNRVIVARIIGNGNNGGGFFQCQIADVFSEVSHGSRPDAVAPLCKVYKVQVRLQNFRFVGFLFQAISRRDFTQLSVRCLFTVAGQVFDQLLGNGGGAEFVAVMKKIVDARQQRPFDVHAVVLKKAFVLDGDQGKDQVFRNFFIADGNAPSRTVQNPVFRYAECPFPVDFFVVIQDAFRVGGRHKDVIDGATGVHFVFYPCCCIYHAGNGGKK